jgi:molybdopterin synthase catalytic subunit
MMAGDVTVFIREGALPDRQAWPAYENAGAVVSFEGVVRATEEDREIEGLDYVAYQPLAERTLELLASDAKERFGVRAVHVEHSRGFVPVGRCSFRLIVAATHRREALDAMDWFIDRLKETVPIWKRPAFRDDLADHQAAIRRS